MMKKIFITTLVVILALSTGCTTSPEEQANAANFRLRGGEIQVALQQYRSALIQAPEEARIYFNIASAWKLAGDLTSAEQALLQAIVRGDEDTRADAFYNLGNLYFEQSRYDEAIDAYQETLRIRADENARYNLELAYAQQLQPTPTAQEMQTEPDEQQANPSVTPSPNPAGQEFPSPTPPPVGPPDLPTPDDAGLTGNSADDERATPFPQEGELTVEDAERVLEPLQERQRAPGGLPDVPVIGATPPGGKDW